jgi:hypothetical protein
MAGDSANIFPFGFGLLANGLQVNDLGLSNLDLDFVFTDDAVADYFQVQLAHTANGRLPVWRYRFDSDGRVLLNKFAECSLKTLTVIISLRPDDHTDYGTLVGARFAHGGATFDVSVV